VYGGEGDDGVVYNVQEAKRWYSIVDNDFMEVEVPVFGEIEDMMLPMYVEVEDDKVKDVETDFLMFLSELMKSYEISDRIYRKWTYVLLEYSMVMVERG
jgi:hypothetical protein